MLRSFHARAAGESQANDALVPDLERGLPLEVVQRPELRPSEGKQPRVPLRALGLALGIAFVFLGGLTLQKRTGKLAVASAPAVGSDRSDRIVGLGTVLPISGVRTIAAPYGAGDARIETLQVREGERVAEGAVLAVLDNEHALLAAVDSARAIALARSAAHGQVASSILASRAEIDAQLARAKIALDAANRELARAQLLFSGGGTTAQTVDQQQSARDEARREVDRLTASLSRYGEASVYAQPDVIVAARNVDAAKADIAGATANLEKAYVRAPIAGTVLTVYSDPGERPNTTKGILTLGDIDRMKVEVEVYQTQIGRVSLGDSARVWALALPRELSGTVAKIGLEVGKQETVDTNPAANTDARVVKVTVNLDEASSKLARGFTHLQVTAEIGAAAHPQGGT